MNLMEGEMIGKESKRTVQWWCCGDEAGGNERIHGRERERLKVMKYHNLCGCKEGRGFCSAYNYHILHLTERQRVQTESDREKEQRRVCQMCKGTAGELQHIREKLKGGEGLPALDIIWCLVLRKFPCSCIFFVLDHHSLGFCSLNL